MFSRIFTGIRNAANTSTATNTITRSSGTTTRLSVEDGSAEEMLRAASTNTILSNKRLSIFGLSSNKADDFIQKDLISTSLI